MPTTIEPTTTIFSGDLIEHAQDYALQCADAMGNFPTMLHVVAGEEITTVPFSLEGLTPSDLMTFAGMTSSLIEAASQITWAALQVPVWMSPTGDIAALLSEPKPHELASEAVAVLVIDAEGTDTYVAGVQRTEDSVNLRRWHLHCDVST